MKTPRILSRECQADSARFELLVPADLHWFQGHFPGHPVLPGVVQVGWVYQLAGEVFARLAPFRGLRAVKFHQLIEPDTRLVLLIERHPQRLDWRYLRADDDSRVCSEGQMRLREAE